MKRQVFVRRAVRQMKLCNTKSCGCNGVDCLLWNLLEARRQFGVRSQSSGRGKRSFYLLIKQEGSCYYVEDFRNRSNSNVLTRVQHKQCKCLSEIYPSEEIFASSKLIWRSSMFIICRKAPDTIHISSLTSFEMGRKLRGFFCLNGF